MYSGRKFPAGSVRPEPPSKEKKIQAPDCTQHAGKKKYGAYFAKLRRARKSFTRNIDFNSRRIHGKSWIRHAAISCVPTSRYSSPAYSYRYYKYPGGWQTNR